MNFKAQSRFAPLNVTNAVALMSQATRLSVEQSCEAVLEEAEAIVPVDTGELRDSGHVTTVRDEGNHVTGSVVFDSPHAAYVEFGTGIRGAESPGGGEVPYDVNWPGMPAQPYLRPALDTTRPHIVEIFKGNAEVAVKLIGK